MSCRQVAYSDSEQPMGRWYITPVQTCSKFSEHPGPVFLLIFNTRRKFVPATTCDSALITPNSCACEHSDPVMVVLVASKLFPFPATSSKHEPTSRSPWRSRSREGCQPTCTIDAGTPTLVLRFKPVCIATTSSKEEGLALSGSLIIRPRRPRSSAGSYFLRHLATVDFYQWTCSSHH